MLSDGALNTKAVSSIVAEGDGGNVREVVISHVVPAGGPKEILRGWREPDLCLKLSGAISGLKQLDKGDGSMGSELLPYRVCCFCVCEASSSDSKLIPLLPIVGWFDHYGLREGCSTSNCGGAGDGMVHAGSIRPRTSIVESRHHDDDPKVLALICERSRRPVSFIDDTASVSSLSAVVVQDNRFMVGPGGIGTEELQKV